MNTILLVDDHHAFRTVFGEILRLRGYSVLDAGTRADVEHLADQHPEPIDLAVIEAVLGMDSGVELARRVGIRNPRARILFVSEQKLEALRAQGLLPAGSPFLRKPFQAEDFCLRWKNSLPLLQAASRAPLVQIGTGKIICSRQCRTSIMSGVFFP